MPPAMPVPLYIDWKSRSDREEISLSIIPARSVARSFANDWVVVVVVVSGAWSVANYGCTLPELSISQADRQSSLPINLTDWPEFNCSFFLKQLLLTYNRALFLVSVTDWNREKRDRGLGATWLDSAAASLFFSLKLLCALQADPT